MRTPNFADSLDRKRIDKSDEKQHAFCAKSAMETVMSVNLTLEGRQFRKSSTDRKEDDVSQYFYTQFVKRISKVKQSIQRSCSTLKTDRDLVEFSTPRGQRIVCNEIVMPPSPVCRDRGNEQADTRKESVCYSHTSMID